MSDFYTLIQRLNEIENSRDPHVTPVAEAMAVSPVEELVVEAAEVEVEEDMETQMRGRLAQFMKAEANSGADLDTVKRIIDEGTAEYEYADRAFSKMAEAINTLEKMVREGGILEKNIRTAGGDVSALEDMRNALTVAYEACERAHYDALGGVVEEE
tara:strand:- start:148 stop:618 length:471 start_codon:yes stop_codon:yes gene_type:complete